MALNDVLTALDGARDALVLAINNKGGSLSDSATLYQCADAVANIQGGGTSAEYYKCASVTPGTAAPEGATFKMTYTLKAFNATFTYNWTMDDTSKTGTERTWSGTVDGESGTSVLKINSAGFWQITDSLGETTASVISNNPWEIADWHNADGGDV